MIKSCYTNSYIRKRCAYQKNHAMENHVRQEIGVYIAAEKPMKIAQGFRK